jgi:hypothetical protein
LCFVSVFVFAAKNDDLCGPLGNTARALARLRHPVASSEALDVHYQEICPALYRRIRMTIKIASNLPAFVWIVDFVVAHNHS